LPEIVASAGGTAVFAAEEFFYGRIRNEHTRAAYLIAVKRFSAWATGRGLALNRITPRDVGQYLNGLRKNTSIATRKQHLAALRHFFDSLVTRHAIILNPALSVRGERYQVVEGKTPEITVTGARELLASIDTATLVGLRDARHRGDFDLHRFPCRGSGHPAPGQLLLFWRSVDVAL
jgi:integrase/recombinase XerD